MLWDYLVSELIWDLEKSSAWLCNPFFVQLLKCLFSSVNSVNRVRLFATLWMTAHQASLSITNFWSLLKLISIELVMPSNHLILCRPLLPPSIVTSIRVFLNESVLHIRWPKYWSFSFRISPSNIQDWFPLGWTGWIFLLSKGFSRVFSTLQFKASVLWHLPFLGLPW